MAVTNLYAVHLLLCQAHDDHLLLPVLQHPQLGLARQQVEHLPAVDLKVAAAHLQVQLVELRRLEQLEDVAGGEGVDAVLGVLRLALKLAAHRVGFARSGLKQLKAFCSRL